MVVERLKTAIDSCWAKYMAFRVAFVAIFLFSMIAISVYAFSVFPFFGWLVLVFVAVYLASGKYRAELPPGFRTKYWWLPLALSALFMAQFPLDNYIHSRIDSLVFSATLCLISIGLLVYYFKRK